MNFTHLWTSPLPQQDDVSVSELYHENSKQQRHNLEFSRRISFVNNSQEIHQIIARSGKVYPGAKTIPLPTVQATAVLSVEQALSMRRSMRAFRREPLPLEALARLLHFGNGITGGLPSITHGLIQPVRAAPSGGALYPIEVYAAVLNADDIDAGLYHYRVADHCLEALDAQQLVTRLATATADEVVFAAASAVFMLTGVFGKTRFKYGERGYRFALLEAGHIAQNLLLEATALGLGAVPIGGFIDDEVNALLDINGIDEGCLYMVAVGHPQHDASSRNSGAESVVSNILTQLWEGQ
jgi:SagB-type dehydrogenase family enzyme